MFFLSHPAVGSTTIDIRALRREISFSNIIKCIKSRKSLKGVALFLLLTAVTLGPSVWDIGSDIIQGQKYLDGDTYTFVTDKNISTNCTLVEITQYRMLHTDQSGLQLSRVLTKNYSATPRVPMGIWGSICDPKTRI